MCANLYLQAHGTAEEDSKLYTEEGKWGLVSLEKIFWFKKENLSSFHGETQILKQIKIVYETPCLGWKGTSLSAEVFLPWSWFMTVTCRPPAKKSSCFTLLSSNAHVSREQLVLPQSDTALTALLQPQPTWLSPPGPGWAQQTKHCTQQPRVPLPRPHAPRFTE